MHNPGTNFFSSPFAKSSLGSASAKLQAFAVENSALERSTLRTNLRNSFVFTLRSSFVFSRRPLGVSTSRLGRLLLHGANHNLRYKVDYGRRRLVRIELRENVTSVVRLTARFPRHKTENPEMTKTKTKFIRLRPVYDESTIYIQCDPDIRKRKRKVGDIRYGACSRGRSCPDPLAF